ncbi:hypothetical protein Ahu01nite_044860 [Winogradskya humida]|uniref:Uncharacterized protein n=1 Tax=Winogradskya humida TaxID=113566 RepID=A0ABQ3ZS40_9ACTN|nr:hypothetical protein Ahu01nite_044860 [Actinoplanes humidus]
MGAPRCPGQRVRLEDEVVDRLPDQVDQWPGDQDQRRGAEQLPAVVAPQAAGVGRAEQIDEEACVRDQPDLDAGTDRREHNTGCDHAAQGFDLMPQVRADGGRRGSCYILGKRVDVEQGNPPGWIETGAGVAICLMIRSPSSPGSTPGP